MGLRQRSASEHDSRDPFAHTYAEARAKFLAGRGRRAACESHPEPLRGVELRDAGDGRRAHRRRRRRRAADHLQRLPRRRGLLRLGRAGGAAARRGVPRAGAPTRASRCCSSTRSTRGASRVGRRVDARGRRPQPQLPRLPPPAARQPGLRRARRRCCCPTHWPPSADNERHADGLRRGARHGGAAGGHLGRPVPAIPTACSTAARRRPGASRRCAMVLRQHAHALPPARLDRPAQRPRRERRRRAHLRRAATTTRAKHRAKAWWGNRITFTYDGSSTSSDLHGNLWHAAYEECRAGRRTPASRWSSARSRPRWCCRRCATTTGSRAGATRTTSTCEPARAAMRHAFFTDTPEWKQAVLTQTRDGGGAGDRRDGRGLAMMS